MKFTEFEYVIIMLALVSVMVSVFATLIALRSRNNRVSVKISEELKPRKYSGLILLIGPSSGSAPTAIEFHLPNLKCCWLVGTNESLQTIQYLLRKYPGVNFFWGDDYMVNPDEVGSTYNVVSRIFNIEVPNTIDVIADITGGLKPMSAGVALACTECQRKMQFMKAPRDQAGSVIRGGIPEPVKVNIILDKSAFKK